MTDLKNLIKMRFPDDGVSVIVYAVIVFFPFLFFYFYFLVDVGRSPSDRMNKYNKHGVAEVSAKEGKTNIYVICIVYVFTSICCF